MLFRLRPGQKGLTSRLHELEAAIMDVVWSKRLASFAVQDIVTVLEQRREIAYTTVMTTVTRLFDKGLLTRQRDGKRYLYAPKYSRAQFLQATARAVLEDVVDEKQAMAMLVEKVADASADELDELETVIRQRREELGV